MGIRGCAMWGSRWVLSIPLVYSKMFVLIRFFLGRLGHWPPSPDLNYRLVLVSLTPLRNNLIFSVGRKGHYVVAEYADKVHNKLCPTFPWQVRASRCPKTINHFVNLRYILIVRCMNLMQLFTKGG
jgi:hypothetical protein